ncbi:hypothetical protein ABK040_014195 [Willaertia magna]
MEEKEKKEARNDYVQVNHNNNNTDDNNIKELHNNTHHHSEDEDIYYEPNDKIHLHHKREEDDFHRNSIEHEDAILTVNNEDYINSKESLKKQIFSYLNHLIYGFPRSRRFLWVFLGGWLLFTIYLISGFLFCLTCCFAPFSVHLFKYSVLMLNPTGYKIVFNKNKKYTDSSLELSIKPYDYLKAFGSPFLPTAFISNVIWFILVGWLVVLLHLIFALMNMVTIVGIGNVIQHYHMIYVAIFPFGTKIVVDENYRRKESVYLKKLEEKNNKKNNEKQNEEEELDYVIDEDAIIAKHV